ncbi:hypothetical protein AYO45_06690 [Gammaproteobacteria bacterium SCGC AG-212-F23]|nr:hypothetical protein AYO45_06690 [Gammaproteobacteria bacterium SCGC AG-212-F23]
MHVNPCDSGSHNYLQWIQNALQSNDRLTSLKLVDPIAPECSIPDGKSNTVKKISALLELNKLYRPRSITDWQSIAFPIAFMRANKENALVGSFMPLMSNIRALVPSSSKKGDPDYLFKFIKELFPPEVKEQVASMKKVVEREKDKEPIMRIENCAPEIIAGIKALQKSLEFSFQSHVISIEEAKETVVIKNLIEFHATIISTEDQKAKRGEEKEIDLMERKLARLRFEVQLGVSMHYSNRNKSILYEDNEGRLLPDREEWGRRSNEISSHTKLQIFSVELYQHHQKALQGYRTKLNDFMASEPGFFADSKRSEEVAKASSLVWLESLEGTIKNEFKAKLLHFANTRLGSDFKVSDIQSAKSLLDLRMAKTAVFKQYHDIINNFLTKKAKIVDDFSRFQDKLSHVQSLSAMDALREEMHLSYTKQILQLLAGDARSLENAAQLRLDVGAAKSLQDLREWHEEIIKQCQVRKNRLRYEIANYLDDKLLGFYFPDQKDILQNASNMELLEDLVRIKSELPIKHKAILESGLPRIFVADLKSLLSEMNPSWMRCKSKGKSAAVLQIETMLTALITREQKSKNITEKLNIDELIQLGKILFSNQKIQQGKQGRFLHNMFKKFILGEREMQNAEKYLTFLYERALTKQGFVALCLDRDSFLTQICNEYAASKHDAASAAHLPGQSVVPSSASTSSSVVSSTVHSPIDVKRPK